MVSLNGLIASPAASTNISTLPMNSVKRSWPNSQKGHIYRLDGYENLKYNETMAYIVLSFKTLFLQSKTCSHEAKEEGAI